MDCSVIAEYGATILFVMGCLVFGVNIIVEVVKKLFPKIPTTFVATVVSVLVTMAAFFAWAAITGLEILWYYVAAAFILGLFVAYGAMFGFDKFKTALEKLKKDK
ncbi:MAG: hypothetical protein E7447_01295 [Ruminococcaceae bacterium]|nr:hypothetical protein [Oscillospiraceae bacterium]